MIMLFCCLVVLLFSCLVDCNSETNNSETINKTTKPQNNQTT